MHDPQTVAFEIKRPWPSRQRFAEARYWPPLVTVWHVDPQMDGSDDSCGFTFPRLTAADLDWAKKQAGQLWRECFGYPSIDLTSAGNREVLMSLWCQVRTQYVHPRRGYIWRPLPRRDVQTIDQLLISSADNLHSLVGQARTWGPEGIEGMERLLLVIIRLQRQLYRPWYRRPRWHVHHWRLQVHPLQHLKRWLFSRCCRCGRRFPWGYSPAALQWDGTGPLWFRSEAGVAHHECTASRARGYESVCGASNSA